MSEFRIIADKSWTIYVLRCVKDKFYVGKTKKSIEERVAEHKANPTAWTEKYPVVELVHSIPESSAFDEDKWTKIYMNRYGIANVRGGTYATIKLQPQQIAFLQQEFMGATDRCYVCGQTGHFARACPFTNQGRPHTRGWKRYFCCLTSSTSSTSAG
jgi:predicted GIY-YIG superfamily endonuclease